MALFCAFPALSLLSAVSH